MQSNTQDYIMYTNAHIQHYTHLLMFFSLIHVFFLHIEQMQFYLSNNYDKLGTEWVSTHFLYEKTLFIAQHLSFCRKQVTFSEPSLTSSQSSIRKSHKCVDILHFYIFGLCAFSIKCLPPVAILFCEFYCFGKVYSLCFGVCNFHRC